MNNNLLQTRGVLIVKPLCAEITDRKLNKVKLRLFCKVRLGEGLLETLPDYKNGKKPVWSSTLRFGRKTETTVRVEVFQKNRFLKARFLGFCEIPLDAMVFISELHGRCSLLDGGNKIGHIDLQIKWEPAQGPSSPIARASFINDNSYSTSSSNSSSIPTLDDTNAYFVTLQHSIGSLGNHHLGPRHISLPYISKETDDLQTILENFINGMKKRIDELKTHHEPEDPNIPEKDRCVVCWGRKKAGVFYTCGHNCCCIGCGVSFIGSRCPMCRELVFDFIKVYES